MGGGVGGSIGAEGTENVGGDHLLLFEGCGGNRGGVFWTFRNGDKACCLDGWNGRG